MVQSFELLTAALSSRSYLIEVKTMFCTADLIAHVVTVNLENAFMSQINNPSSFSNYLFYKRETYCAGSCNRRKSDVFFYNMACSLSALLWHPRSCVSSQLYRGGRRSHLVTARGSLAGHNQVQQGVSVALVTERERFLRKVGKHQKCLKEKKKDFLPTLLGHLFFTFLH